MLEYYFLDLNHIYFASVDFQNEGLIETGSRTIASLSINDSIYDAEKNAEQYISSVKPTLEALYDQLDEQLGDVPHTYADISKAKNKVNKVE